MHTVTIARKLRIAAIVAFASVVLAGCAQLPRQAFNAQGAGHVKTVVLVHHENQKDYEAAVLGHPGMSFGLIGGLIAAADMQIKSGKLTTAIDPNETRVQERFGEKLRAGLAKAGYQPVVLVLPKGKTADEAMAQAKQQAQGDAIVVVDVIAGYWAAGPSTDYVPRLRALVKAVDTKSGKTLYEDQITYGYAMPNAPTVHLASDPAFRFGSIDALIADPARTREGLYQGIDAIAAQIAVDLKK